MRRVRGFTVVELLAATVLFAVLGVMLFQTVSGASDVWRRGERNRELTERAQAVFDLLAEDLRHAWGGVRGAAEQEARFICSWRQTQVGDAGGPSLRVAALRFTRLLHEGRRLAMLRAAGDVVGGTRAAMLRSGEDPLDLMPSGGLAESLYTVERLPGSAGPTLLRRVRARAGGQGSLVAEDALERADRLLADAVPVAADVLHFGLGFDGPPGSGPDGDGRLEVWDSTRGLLGSDERNFPYAAGSASLWQGHDDVLPSLVHVLLVLDDGERPGTLASPLGIAGERLLLAPGARLGMADHVLVDDEWMAIVARHEEGGGVFVVVRGVRGSVPAAHEVGAQVAVGRTFTYTVRIPAARENHER